ncbi:MAG: 6-pyruvoyl-tetrahydropterin synthase-related protein [Geitlerinemataceae cyanobacterium]
MLKHINRDKAFDFISVGALLAISILLSHRMLGGDVLVGSDGQYHIRWLVHFFDQIQAGNLYPRWLPHTNYGYGSPNFVFYSPLAYYLGSFFFAFGADIPRVLAGIYILSFSVGSVALYCFLKSLSGQRLPALLAALLFALSPFIIWDAYDRLALSSLLATCLFPVLLWTTHLAATGEKYKLTLSFTSLIITISHPPSFILFNLFWFPYLFWMYSSIPIRRKLEVCGYMVLGWGLAAFYLVPAALEKHLISSDALKGVMGGISNNIIGIETPKNNNSFVAVRKIWWSQLRFFITLAVLSFFTWKHRTERFITPHKVVAVFLAVLFFTHKVSLSLWETIKPLEIIQFPFRLMPLLAVAIALLFYTLMAHKHVAWVRYLAIFLCLISLTLNLRYAKRLITDQPSYQEPRWITELDVSHAQQRRLKEVSLAVSLPRETYLQLDEFPDVPEYRPFLETDRGIVPVEPRRDEPKVTIEDGRIERVVWNDLYRSAAVSSDRDTCLRFRTYVYPAWKAFLNGERASISMASDGGIQVCVTAGDHLVEIEHSWTRAMYVGTAISALSLTTVAALFLRSFVQTRKDYG